MTVIRENILEIKGFLEKKHLEFHEKIKEICVNRQRFKGGFKVNYSHIDKKSGVEFVRANLGDEQLASVIRGGQLNFEECQAKGSNCSEVAIEACMLIFSVWILVKMKMRPSRCRKSGCGLSSEKRESSMW